MIRYINNINMDKDILGLAAEYAVASELCRRNIYAQLTLGLRRRTDILVETERGMLRIQVKGKQGKVWPGCKGIYGSDIVLVFVDFENKGENERPDFYVLTVKDWEALINEHLISKGLVKNGHVTIDEKNMPTWKEGYQGMAVKPDMIKEYMEQWDKILKRWDLRMLQTEHETAPNGGHTVRAYALTQMLGFASHFVCPQAVKERLQLGSADR